MEIVIRNVYHSQEEVSGKVFDLLSTKSVDELAKFLGLSISDAMEFKYFIGHFQQAVKTGTCRCSACAPKFHANKRKEK